MLRQIVVWIFSLGATVPGAVVASAQNYPSKPIRLMTGGIGGGNDFTSRLLAQGLTDRLGQPVIVDNRAVAIIASETVSKAPPDGYTVLVSGSSLWIGTLTQKAPYDPVKDFSPITLINTQTNVLVVNSTVPANSVKELIALAKAKPGQLNYSASASLGAASSLAAELFKSMAGVNILRVPYKSVSLRMAGLLSNEVQLEFATPSGLGPHIKAGRLKALAVTSAQPSALFPGLPTVAAAGGLPGYEMAGVYGFFAPAKTPEAIIKRLNRESVHVLGREDVKEKFWSAGIETVGSSPKELAAAIKSEMARLGKVVKDVGIGAE